MHILLQTVIAIGGGALLSLLIASSLVGHLPDIWVRRMVSLAAGTLLSVALLDLLPSAFESSLPAHSLFATLLFGLLLFFTLEKTALWQHNHHHEHDGHEHGAGFDRDTVGRSGGLILLGSATHNFADGVLIAAAFLSDNVLGWAMTLAILAHTIPQDIGNMIIMMNSGYPRRQAIGYQLLSAVAGLVGGILTLYTLGDYQAWLPYMLVIAAASFLYIAVADLIPWMHRQEGREEILWQIGLVLLGVGLIASLHAL